MNIIEVRNLCYAYEDDAPALDNVSLNIAAGKTTAVLGGNGAGKSTLFLNLNGVLTPKSGKVFFEGTEVRYSKKELPELRRKIVIVFQDPDDQLFSASVTKDISFGLMKFGLTREEIQERVDRVVRQTGIEHIVGKPTHALSFGQKKRVAIAGILVMQPSVIILDEPTADSDPQGCQRDTPSVEGHQGNNRDHGDHLYPRHRSGASTATMGSYWIRAGYFQRDAGAALAEPSCCDLTIFACRGSTT